MEDFLPPKISDYKISIIETFFSKFPTRVTNKPLYVMLVDTVTEPFRIYETRALCVRESLYNAIRKKKLIILRYERNSDRYNFLISAIISDTKAKADNCTWRKIGANILNA